MGFFSVLFFLIDHPLRSLTIVTIENKKAVLLNIFYHPTKKNLYFNLNYITTESVSGTYIYMDASLDNFKAEQLRLFNYFTDHNDIFCISLLLFNEFFNVSKKCNLI